MLFTIRYHHDHLLDMSNASSIVQDREAGLGFAESPIIADILRLPCLKTGVATVSSSQATSNRFHSTFSHWSLPLYVHLVPLAVL